MTKNLTLNSMNYNIARIIQELYKIIVDKGGYIVSDFATKKEAIYITNRSLTEKIIKLQQQKERVETINTNTNKFYTSSKKATTIENLTNEINKLMAIDNTPKKVNFATFGSSYISFVLDDSYYYYQTDDNPFFDFYFSKSPVNNNIVAGNRYLDSDTKDWLTDDIFTFYFTDKQAKEKAIQIFNMLINAPYSKKHDNRTKKIFVCDVLEG